ncbi:MAG TPA: D-alanyl-D-alanine carboxypeptidase family protein [Rhizobiaceae bacterium]|nr:D-alanyl-D-alanine carboxypeptidase family protein [Rhizobiaceae bacterium]
MRLFRNDIGQGFLRRAALTTLAGALLAGCVSSQPRERAIIPPQSSKYAAIVVDSTGRTLYAANASATRYPASLTKMMTLYLLFEAVDSGRVSKATEIPFSDNARRQPPSKLGVKRGETIDVETAINALTVKSGNDVAVAVAEFLGGSESQFAAQMTARARSLGMTGTVFQNASGLPDEGQRTTARDMALLGMALRSRFPHHFGYFSRQSFVYRGRVVRGHNELIGGVPGVDGIKTGYIRSSGYNIVTSVGRGGKRLYIVVMGGDSAGARNNHVKELIAKYMSGSSSSGGGALGAMLWD